MASSISATLLLCVVSTSCVTARKAGAIIRDVTRKGKGIGVTLGQRVLGEYQDQGDDWLNLRIAYTPPDPPGGPWVKPPPPAPSWCK